MPPIPSVQMRAMLCLWALTAAAAPAPFRIFTFRVGFWTNLHHFAYAIGRAQNGTPDSKRRAIAGAVTESAAAEALPPTEQSTWNALVRSYQDTWSRKDPIVDHDLARLVLKLADTSESSTPSATELKAAEPIYREVWWPRHSAADRARIADLELLLDRYGPSIVTFLEKKYRQVWPPNGFTVEVSAYANWAGAYSTEEGLIVISSTDPETAGDQGLEIVFHEAMHQWDDATISLISRTARELQMDPPHSLSHSLIFYTAGYAVSRVIPNHKASADVNGLWSRGGLVPKEVLDAKWKPYLNGDGSLEDAIRAVLAGLKKGSF